MRMRQIFIAVVGGLALVAAYLWLVVELNGWSALFLRPGLWLSKTFGVPHGMLIWMVVLNTIAVALAAAPVAIAARVIFGRWAWIAALAVGSAVGTFSLAESLRVVSWSQLFSIYPTVQVLDNIKLVVIPVLLVLAIQRKPSNTRWSGPHHG